MAAIPARKLPENFPNSHSMIVQATFQKLQESLQEKEGYTYKSCV
jgi:hypothetical protein